MKRISRTALALLIGLALLATVLPATAQETALKTLPNGVTITHPSQWTMETDEEGITEINTGVNSLSFFYRSPSDLAFANIPPGDTIAVLADFHKQNQDENDPNFDASTIETTTLNGVELTYLQVLDGDDYYRLRGVLPSAGGGMIIFSAYPYEGVKITELESLLEVASTATYGTYYFEDGSFVTIPADWEAYLDDQDYVRFDNGTTGARLVFYNADGLASLGTTAKNLNPVLEDLFLSANDETLIFDPKAVTSVQPGTVRHEFIDTYEGEQYERVHLAFVLPDQTVLGFDIAPNTDFEIPDADEQTVLDIAASFQLPGGTPVSNTSLTATNAFAFEDGSTLNYSDAWTVTTNDKGLPTFDNGTTSAYMGFYSPEFLAEIGATAKNLNPMLETMLAEGASATTLVLDKTLITPVQYGAFNGLRYGFVDTLEGEQFERVFYITLQSDGWLMFANIYPNAGFELSDADEQAALEILASFQFPPE